MKRFCLAFALVLVSLPLVAASVFVDASEARRGLFHTSVTIPLKSGQATFVYPKWVPGEHTPTGPVMQMTALHVRAGGREIPWTRDPVEMFAFHVDVPPGADAVNVAFDYVSPSSTFGAGYGESANATQNLLLLLFNHVVVYPAGIRSDDIDFTASVRLPSGWSFDTALPIAKRDGDRVDFAPVSLTTLIDSPLVAGAYQRRIAAGDSGAEHVTVTADSAQALAMTTARATNVENLVAEADALFGARHYRQYTWLVTLSDLIEPQGLEHHESTDIRYGERALLESDQAARLITILSHEFVHSWNGKYRRPAGLATPNYQEPMLGELLWVYEGMTRYLGDFVLSARSGMRSAEEDREYVAFVVANQERNRPGRDWRPLADTAVAVQSIAVAPGEDLPMRRGLDYYDESGLIWLEADAIIRAKSGGRKSMDDFANLFFGAPASAPMVRPYTLDDVVNALNTVVPNDWRAFLVDRIYKVATRPPMPDATGWRLVYNDTPNWYGALRERTGKVIDATFSLGIWVKNDGTISDVVSGSPAAIAGLRPKMKITALNGRKFDDDVLREEIRAKAPIDVFVEQGSFAGRFHIDYSGGERFPHLQRIDSAPDYLSDIMRAHAPRPLRAAAAPPSPLPTARASSH
ncbi:MAG TPA: M61 family peptidase [Thermoanaerobaculia bacterium]|nr:M61 family peptidase [Thermoanaerobaculia bacterium]